MKHRKITALIMALCMVLSLGITALADEPTNKILGKPPVEGQPILVDCDFETLDEDGKVPDTHEGIIPSSAYKPENYSKWFSVVEDSERGGKVLRIKDNDFSNHPWFCWDTPIVPGAKYQLSGYCKRASVGDDGYPQIFIEYFEEDNTYHDGGAAALTFITKGSGWGEFAHEFVVPNIEAVRCRVYVRLIADGDIYYDDISFYMTENAPHLANVDSGFFYYTDEAVGRAKVEINTVTYPDFEGDTVEMQILDGETVLEEATFAAQSGEIIWNFPTIKLTKVEKSYTFRAAYVNKDGEVLQQEEREVLIYNRPKNLTKDGYILDDDGTKIHPVIGYMLYPKTYAKTKEMGITVPTGCYQAKDLELALDSLDKAEAAGVKLLMPMYSNMYPAGYSANVEYTVAAIKAFQNHPAFLGYMVMDEPFGHIGKVGGADKMYQILQDSYKLIRQYDKEHLIYLVETAMKYVEMAGNCCDLLTVDPYIGVRVNQRGRWVSQDVEDAITAIEGRKPVCAIVQAWKWNGGQGDVYYEPTANDIRSFLYQALISGANGLGYCRIEDIVPPIGDVPSIWDLELIEGINYFNENEWEDAQKAFITGEYPTFAQNELLEETPVWYKVFVKDKDLYAVVINRQDQVNTVEIPLTSIDGSVTIGEFKAEPDEISGIEPFEGNGTLKLELTEAQTVRIKLTVSEDLSGLTTSRYRDIYNYGWAKPSIDRMYQKGVTNQKGLSLYAPAEQITRGDFAMFLVKTLGLTAYGTGNFEDVNPNAEYADAIRIGKALGILKGTDGVNFEPETPISRQDFMVICARGMRLKKKLQAGDASQFTDAASIADYAVEDIAAMVQAKIVAGYEDGTVRPLGNTTRAEAAVIMDRLTNWQRGR